MKIGIIGCDGFVGKAMVDFFVKGYSCAGVDAAWKEQKQIVDAWDNINKNCELGVVCVPTPMSYTAECDTSIVKEVVQRLETPLILIKSTVPPGTTDRLREETGKRIVFSPEFCGEPDYDPGHNFQNTVANEPFYIFGGDSQDTSKLVDIIQRIAGPTKKYFQCTAKEAETIKYFENTFLGVKVLLSYEFHQICNAIGVDWNTVRSGWLLDPRVNPSHTSVFHDQGAPFGGKCLPKDINALVKFSEKAGYLPEFIEELLKSNTRLGKLRGFDKR